MDIFSTVLQFIIDILAKKPKELIEVSLPIGGSNPSEPPKPAEVPKIENIPSIIDWTDKLIHVTEHFTVADCITLHSWNRLANEQDGLTDEIKSNILFLCGKMEEIRKVLDCTINVHCIYRSPDYNTQVVKAIAHDVHSMGFAIDFDVNSKHTIEEAQAILLPLLEQYGLRMEQKTPTWIHLDFHKVGNARYFLA